MLKSLLQFPPPRRRQNVGWAALGRLCSAESESGRGRTRVRPLWGHPSQCLIAQGPHFGTASMSQLHVCGLHDIDLSSEGNGWIYWPTDWPKHLRLIHVRTVTCNSRCNWHKLRFLANHRPALPSERAPQGCYSYWPRTVTAAGHQLFDVTVSEQADIGNRPSPVGLGSVHTGYLCFLCGSENKQRLFHCTALTGWFL